MIRRRELNEVFTQEWSAVYCTEHVDCGTAINFTSSVYLGEHQTLPIIPEWSIDMSNTVAKISTQVPWKPQSALDANTGGLKKIGEKASEPIGTNI